MSTITDLVPTLYEKTQNGKIGWQINAAEEEIFVRIGRNLIEIDTYQSGRDTFVRLAIRNDEGKIVDMESFDVEIRPGDQLLHIYQTGRRIALKIDETIDDVLSKLSEL